MKINGLTPQQHRAAQLVAAAETDKEIARALCISPSGVGKILDRISKTWKLDPSKNRRAQITRRIVELESKQSAA